MVTHYPVVLLRPLLLCRAFISAVCSRGHYALHLQKLVASHLWPSRAALFCRSSAETYSRLSVGEMLSTFTMLTKETKSVSKTTQVNHFTTMTRGEPGGYCQTNFGPRALSSMWCDRQDGVSGERDKQGPAAAPQAYTSLSALARVI